MTSSLIFHIGNPLTPHPAPKIALTLIACMFFLFVTGSEVQTGRIKTRAWTAGLTSFI